MVCRPCLITMRLTPITRADCVKLLPMWLAPNLVTLSGLFCLIVAYIANAYYLPDFVGRPRSLPQQRRTPHPCSGTNEPVQSDANDHMYAVLSMSIIPFVCPKRLAPRTIHGISMPDAHLPALTCTLQARHHDGSMPSAASQCSSTST